MSKTSFHVKFNPEEILLGYIYHNPNFVALNMLIIVTKSYIFLSSRKGQELNKDLAVFFTTTFPVKNSCRVKRSKIRKLGKINKSEFISDIANS